jgi:CheY-like chemotaxis protein
VDAIAPELRGRGRVLFVDDEEPLVQVGARLLESLGYEVDAVTAGAECLALFRANPDAYVAVITDQTMPKMTGAELTVALVKIRPDIPIILCSGFSDQIDDTRARVLGAKIFLPKPYSRLDLAAALHQVTNPSD